jgi:thiamine-phosphate pyrophosphorylase
MLLYYITDRTQFPGDEAQRQRRLLEKITEAARWRVDYIQLREKDLRAREMEVLARKAAEIIRENESRWTGHSQLPSRLLLNSRTDVALAAGADGVHLRSDDISPREVRKIWQQCGTGAPARERRNVNPIVGVSCHLPDEVARAATEGADFGVFAPVFEKGPSRSTPPLGLEALRKACNYSIPVLALGGVTLENASACVDAGAAGIAAIRLFQDQEIAEVVRTLRS